MVTYYQTGSKPSGPVSFLQPSFRLSLPSLPSSCPPLLPPTSGSLSQDHDGDQVGDQVLAEPTFAESGATGEIPAGETSYAPVNTVADMMTTEVSPESSANHDDRNGDGFLLLLNGDTPLRQRIQRKTVCQAENCGNLHLRSSIQHDSHSVIGM